LNFHCKTLQREISILQTVVLGPTQKFVINNVVHREEKHKILIKEKGWKYIRKVYGNNGYRDGKYFVTYTLPADMSISDTVWVKNGKIHRTEKDRNGLTLPATVCSYRKRWFNNGKLHRNDKVIKQIYQDICGRNYEKLNENLTYTLPALLSTEERGWYINGQEHRDDVDINGQMLPSFVNKKTIQWKQNNVFYRPNKDENGYTLPTLKKCVHKKRIHCWIKYWINERNLFHRDEKNKNGITLPAIIACGYNMWYINGEKQRNDFIVKNNIKYTLPFLIQISRKKKRYYSKDENEF